MSAAYNLRASKHSLHLIPTPWCPLYLHEKNGIKAIARLIEGTHYVVMIPQLAGVPTKLLKKAAYSLEAKRSDIINALDLLFTGF